MKKIVIIIAITILSFSASMADSYPLQDFVEAARKQIGKTVFYDPSYQSIAYPNGDVSPDRGVCTDVVIRALRSAYGFDLQKYIHEDMGKNFAQYPQIWGLRKPDKNIDHRRVPNIQIFFARKGWVLSLSKQISAFQPGDIVTCIVPPNRPHIMIISNRRNKENVPLVIHNIGNGTQEEDQLFAFELTGHYRIRGVELLLGD